MGSGRRFASQQLLFFPLLIILALSFTSRTWALPASDVALIGLMMDSYRLKIATWSGPDAYTEKGPGIDVRPLELSMEQRLMHVDDSEERLRQAGDRLKASAKEFALDWQTKGYPQWHFVLAVEKSGKTFGETIKASISNDGQSRARADQVGLLLQLASIYIYMGGESSIAYDLEKDNDIEKMVADLDQLLADNPVSDRAFTTKWRFIKPVILKMDYRAPGLVRRHALSMAQLLERSLEE